MTHSPLRAQLMSDAELDPASIQGDRFDLNDGEGGSAPDLEEEPGQARDILPDTIRDFPDLRRRIRASERPSNAGPTERLEQLKESKSKLEEG